jgi:hypothetical protein
MPDPVETLRACEQLAREGFVVLPYIHADPVLAKRLEDVGAAAVMPLGAPIGSNLGLRSRDFLHIIIEQANVPVIVDAGLGAPSHAAEAMEMGADAVLVNTALATASAPAAMSRAFKLAVEAGRLAFENGLAPPAPSAAAPTSPLTAFLDYGRARQPPRRRRPKSGVLNPPPRRPASRLYSIQLDSNRIQSKSHTRYLTRRLSPPAAFAAHPSCRTGASQFVIRNS